MAKGRAAVHAARGLGLEKVSSLLGWEGPCDLLVVLEALCHVPMRKDGAAYMQKDNKSTTGPIKTLSSGQDAFLNSMLETSPHQPRSPVRQRLALVGQEPTSLVRLGQHCWPALLPGGVEPFDRQPKVSLVLEKLQI